MSVPLFTHPDMIDHRPGVGHPERPERLGAVLDALDDAGLAGDRREAEEAGKLREQARAEARAVRKGDGEGSQPAEPDGPVADGGPLT